MNHKRELGGELMKQSRKIEFVREIMLVQTTKTKAKKSNHAKYGMTAH